MSTLDQQTEQPGEEPKPPMERLLGISKVQEGPDLPYPADILLGDPLREPTRKERRALLGVSAIAMALTFTGMVPEKISALGIDMSSKNKDQLLLIFAGVVLYFLVAFIAYAASDFIAWGFRTSVSVTIGNSVRLAPDGA